MEDYIKENEEYRVACCCKDCYKSFGMIVMKKDLDAKMKNLRCTVCESPNISVVTEQVRQILME
jgi:Zn finger protein HypA/HybF involved in hydrogenase expression